MNYSYSYVPYWGFNYPVAPRKYYIIISTCGASQHPARHSCLEDAEREATRLARKHPGQEFTVYQTTKSFKAEDKPITVTTFV